MFPYQTRCFTKTDKSTTVNIIQRSCGSTSKQEKPQKFKNQHASILFHLFARILGSRLQLLSKTVKIRMKQIVQLTIYKNKHLMLGECFKQTPCNNWLPSKICCRYAEIALKNKQHLILQVLKIHCTLQVPTEAKNFLLIIPTNAFRLNTKPDRFKNDAWPCKPL